jgi:hypothetical protein
MSTLSDQIAKKAEADKAKAAKKSTKKTTT